MLHDIVIFSMLALFHSVAVVGLAHFHPVRTEAMLFDYWMSIFFIVYFLVLSSDYTYQGLDVEAVQWANAGKGVWKTLHKNFAQIDENFICLCSAWVTPHNATE